MVKLSINVIVPKKKHILSPPLQGIWVHVMSYSRVRPRFSVTAVSTASHYMETTFSINYLLRDVLEANEKKKQRTSDDTEPDSPTLKKGDIFPSPCIINLINNTKAGKKWKETPIIRTPYSREELLSKWLHTLRATTYHFMEQYSSINDSDKIACIFSEDCSKIIRGKGNLRRHVEWHLRRIEEAATKRKLALFPEVTETNPYVEETQDIPKHQPLTTEEVFEGIV